MGALFCMQMTLLLFDIRVVSPFGRREGWAKVISIHGLLCIIKFIQSRWKQCESSSSPRPGSEFTSLVSLDDPDTHI